MVVAECCLLPLLTGSSREHGAAHCVNHGQHVCAVNVTQTYSSKDKIGRAVRLWAPRWNEVANRLTRLTWLGEYPQVFAAMQTEENPDDLDFFQGVHFVNLDGKVFPCDKSRLHNVIKRALYSSKTKNTGMQVLVWSMPCGTPILVRGRFMCSKDPLPSLSNMLLALLHLLGAHCRLAPTLCGSRPDGSVARGMRSCVHECQVVELVVCCGCPRTRESARNWVCS